MDRHVAAHRGTYLDWSVSPSLSNVAEVYSLAMLHYSRMPGPEMFDCSVSPPQTPPPNYHHHHHHLPSLTHLVALSCNIGSAERAAVFSSLLASRGTQPCLGGLVLIPSRF